MRAPEQNPFLLSSRQTIFRNQNRSDRACLGLEKNRPQGLSTKDVRNRTELVSEKGKGCEVVRVQLRCMEIKSQVLTGSRGKIATKGESVDGRRNPPRYKIRDCSDTSREHTQ